MLACRQVFHEIDLLFSVKVLSIFDYACQCGDESEQYARERERETQKRGHSRILYQICIIRSTNFAYDTRETH